MSLSPSSTDHSKGRQTSSVRHTHVTLLSPDKVSPSTCYSPPTDHSRDDGTNFPARRKKSTPITPDGSLWRQQSILRETNTRTTPPSHSQSTSLLSPPDGSFREQRNAPYWMIQKLHGTLSRRRRLAPSRPFVPDGSFWERQSVLYETDTCVTLPSPDTFIYVTALLCPQRIIPGTTEPTHQRTDTSTLCS